ncbi:MAG: hypothetical protein LV480_00280 [Methylacidiphilales bacterium]|nr:hypothetical protein [Candidatus Methylacidiphilales bacterium]
MSESELPEDFAERRRHLIADIARQRGELAVAYRNLERPIHYAEYGLRGFGFLRKNPWVFMAVPTAFKLASVLMGLKKKKASDSRPNPRRNLEGKPKGFGKHIVALGKNGWRLFQLYRRIKPYFL